MADQKKSVPVTDDLCLTKINFRRCTYLWAIENFLSVHYKRKRVLKSLPFSASDDEFKWQLHFNPSYDANYCSLYLYPADTSANFSSHSPITGKLKFALINAENEETSVQNTEFTLTHPAGPLYTGFNSFIAKSTLTNIDSKLLSQDKLTIFCEVSYVKETDIVNISAKPFPNSLEQHEPACLDDIEALLMNEEFSDVTLTVKDKTYPAHKSILVARSPVFRAALKHNTKEKQCNSYDIKDISVPAFEEMLRYIYTGKVKNLNEMAPELLAAADKYDLQNLKVMCEEELYRRLSLETAVNTLMLADMYHAEILKMQALLFIKTHSYTSNILDEEVRKSLIKSFPHLLLEIIDTFGKQCPM